MKNFSFLIFFGTLVFSNFDTSAEVRLPSILGNHMVLQQKSEVNLWGWCSHAEMITVKSSWDTTKYKIAGAIWYQGESNTSNYNTYSRLMAKMIGAWRSGWGNNFPFYFVQIAPFAYGNYNVGALIREQQTACLSIPKTGMVVVHDLVDDVHNIHPVKN